MDNTESRVTNSAKNVGGSFIQNFVYNIIRFISRTVFIHLMGETFLGVNSLFTNVLSVLSLAELGIGTAINYSLYKPLAEKNNEKIRTLMQFYKKAYRIIALIVTIIGLSIIPFLGVLIKDGSGIDNIILIYLLFLFNMTFSYLYSYKRTLIVADQKSYKLVPILLTCNIAVTVIQIAILFMTKNFILYLVAQSVFVILENIIVSKYIDKKYPILIEKTPIQPMEEEEKKTLKKNVKALIFHRIGEVLVHSVDSLIISAFISIAVVGIYSNYLLLLTMIQSFISLLFGSIVASVGNLIASDRERSHDVFKITNFICFSLYCVSAICFYNLFNPFITIWAGEKFLLPIITVNVIVINFYLTGMRTPTLTFKNAAGIYDADKYDPIVQAIVKLVISIILVNYMGITGVFLGSVISGMIPCVRRPIILYRELFKMKSIHYFKVYAFQILLVTLAAFGSGLLLESFNLPSGVLEIAIRLLVSVSIPSIIILILFHKTEEFKYVLSLVRKVLKRGKFNEEG